MTVVLIIINLITMGIAYYMYVIIKELNKFLKEQREQDELKVMNGDKNDETSYEEYLNSVSVEMENNAKYDINPKTNEYNERIEENV